VSLSRGVFQVSAITNAATTTERMQEFVVARLGDDAFID
jgi:hypothetical protein